MEIYQEPGDRELDEQGFAVALREALTEAKDLFDEGEDFIDNGLVEGYQEASTFEEVMMLTRNAGLVVHLADGTEYQVTIVRSR